MEGDAYDALKKNVSKGAHGRYCAKMIMSEELLDQVRYLQLLIDVSNTLIAHSNLQYSKECIDHDALTLFKMMSSKLSVVKRIVKEPVLTFDGILGDNMISHKIVDHVTLYAVIRTLFESLCVYELIYVFPQTKEEKELIYHLYQLAGASDQYAIIPDKEKYKAERTQLKEEKRTCRIPNQEVRQEFERTIQDTGWEVIANAINNSEQLLKDTLAGNEEAVAKAMETVHQQNTSILQYNDENALAYVVSLAYQSAHQYYKFIRELPAGKGFADIVLVPYRNIDKPAIVIELKYNKSAEGAIEQIKEKQYVDALRGFVGEIVLVGINYDKRTKRHECKVERISDKTSDKFPINSPISDKLQIVIAYMKSHDAIITQVEVAKMFAVSDRQARNYLAELVNAGLVKPQGANKNRIYVLV